MLLANRLPPFGLMYWAVFWGFCSLSRVLDPPTVDTAENSFGLRFGGGVNPSKIRFAIVLNIIFFQGLLISTIAVFHRSHSDSETTKRRETLCFSKSLISNDEFFPEMLQSLKDGTRVRTNSRTTRRRIAEFGR